MLYTGFHAIEERLRREKSGRGGGEALLTLYYAAPGPRAKKIIAWAASRGVRCVEVTGGRLDSLVKGLDETARDHRGLVLSADRDTAANTQDLNLWLSSCPERATVLALDGVTDPHNTGAVIRSCDLLGANLLIIPKANSASVDGGGVVARASAGASAWVAVSRVSNLVRALETLKDAGFWIYAADMGGAPVNKTDFAEKTCIVLGSEGRGVSRLVKATCDATVAIPTCGKLDSLNVSVAAGILLYERRRQGGGLS